MSIYYFLLFHNSLLVVYRLLQDIDVKPMVPGDILSYIINEELLICIMITPIHNNPSFYKCLEKAYNKMKLKMTGYRYLALQQVQINSQKYCFSQCIKLLKFIFGDKNSEIWICGNTDAYRSLNQLNEFNNTVKMAIDNNINDEHSNSSDKNCILNKIE